MAAPAAFRAAADPVAPSAPASAEPAWIGTGVGDGSILRKWQPILGSVDYRFPEDFWGIHPKILVARSTTASNYVQMGLLWNWDPDPMFRVTLSTGPGVYQRNHDAGSIHFWLEFYSSMEVSTRLPWGGHRLGVSFGHISDASIHRPNPGAEVLALNYLIPLGRIPH